MKMKKAEINPLLILIIFVVLLIIGLAVFMIQLNRQLDTNEKEIGLRISNGERECYEFCAPDNYYYKSGNTDKPVVCNCRRY